MYIIRHGESVANTEGKYQGQTYNTTLSELGQKQADALGVRLKDEKITRVVTSPLIRTFQTAKAIANWHKELQIEIEPDIIETNHGAWEGEEVRTIKDKWPIEFDMWQNSPSCVLFPEGEAFEDTRTRVLDWWKSFFPTVRGTTVVVTHDNILRTVIANTLGMHPDLMWRFELQPTAVTTVKVIGGQVKVGIINDTNHLEGLQANLANHAL